MKINSFCLACLINMQESQVRKFDDEEKKMAYIRGSMRSTGGSVTAWTR